MEALANLGIDLSSLLLYLVNTGILLIVLTKYLYRPLLRYLDERRALVKKNIQEAEALKKNFQKELDRETKATRELVAKLENEVKEARLAAELRAKQLLSEAEKQKEAMLTDASKQVDAMKAGLHREIEREVIERVEKVVTAVLKNRLPAEIVLQSVKEEWEQVNKKL